MNDDPSFDFDQEALSLYGRKFEQLSPFGQNLVRQRVTARKQPEVTMQHVDVVQALRAAQVKIARLEQEIKDLWEDNEDLQLRLMEGEGEDEDRTSRPAQER